MNATTAIAAAQLAFVARDEGVAGEERPSDPVALSAQEVRRSSHLEAKPGREFRRSGEEHGNDHDGAEGHRCAHGGV